MFLDVYVRVRWFWLVLDGGGRFLPAHRLFYRVLALFRFFLMFWPVMDVFGNFMIVVVGFGWF